MALSGIMEWLLVGQNVSQVWSQKHYCYWQQTKGLCELKCLAMNIIYEIDLIELEPESVNLSKSLDETSLDYVWM